MALHEEIEEALSYLKPSDLSYDQWLSVGMALKNEGMHPDLWESWSVSDGNRYHSGECFRKWETFSKSGMNASTIFYLCKEKAGHVVRSSHYRDDKPTLCHAQPLPKPIIRPQEPGEDWNPVEDLKRYLILLFNPGDYIGYCVQSRWNEDRKKYDPQAREPGHNKEPRTAQMLIDKLAQAGQIEEVFGNYDPLAGAWIMINPLTGKKNEKGRYASKETISDFRYCLIESDNIPVKDQIDIYQKMRLPVVCVTHSGSRSAHAVVRVNAVDQKQYEERVQKLYEECDRNGLQVDTNNKDVTRLSRAPGFFRNGHKQYLMCGSFGSETYEDWERTLYVRKLPDPIPVNLIHNPPPKPVPIIEDTLHPGEIMLISGPPKAGKSFLTMQMGLAVATGCKFIGLKCKQGSVLYIDGELNPITLIERTRLVMEKMGIQRFPDNMSILPIHDLIDKIKLEDVISDIEHDPKKWDLIILDPYYVLSNVDENSNSELRQEITQLSRLKKLGSAVVILHHQTKGYQGGKANIDRAAGGSTFARYVDTVASLNLLETRSGDTGIPERYEATNRSFPPKNRGTFIDLLFDGIHFPDRSGELEDRSFLDPAKASREKNQDKQIQRTNHVYFLLKDRGILQDGKFTLKQFGECYREQYGNRDRTTLSGDLERAGFIHDQPGSGRQMHYWRDGERDPEEEAEDDPQVIDTG